MEWLKYFSVFVTIVVSLNYEKDIAEYTVKVATDPRTENGLVIYRLPKCVINQLDLISIWEKKTGRALEKTYVTERKLINLSESKIIY